ncbi:MAG: UvrD-helicase domain-containing protein [Chloroflexi bacterium]|nr:UvrD-helicase domain-containing protein [Chloroflexota bacterium]
MLDLSRLTPEQRQAVLTGDGPLLIVAGPGSGKTLVLAARIAYLVTGRQVSPASILAITFTTRAARELRTRLGAMLGASGRDVDVTTFHAFGLRIVRHWSEELGLGPGPVAVYGDAEAMEALRHAADEAGIDLEEESLVDLARGLERFRLTGDAPPELAERLRALAEAYESLLHRRGVVDYAAMLALPLRLFNARPEVLRLYQDAYRHVLSDEFQDVCAVQYTLLRQLTERHRNLAVVGDPRQTLYGWRGADVRFLVDFQRDFPEASVVSLDRNFRSTGHIVEVANALGAALPYGLPLWTDNPPGDLTVLYMAQDERAEASFVAAEIERLCTERLVQHPGEVAILYRTNQQAYPLTATLRERRVPYRVRGSGDLFTRREVRDTLAYLRLAYQPADAAALARIVNVPPRRLARLADDLRKRPAPIGELPARAERYGASAVAGAVTLRSLIEDLHRATADLRPAQALDLVLDQTGYRSWLAGQPDGAARLAHLGVLRALAADAATNLGDWLADLQVGEDAGSPAEDHESVVLSTIHGAKGGEWRAVFVVGVEEGLLPHYRPLLVQTSEATGLEDELRVAYVAVTRPRERLYLTLCRSRRRGERTVPRHPSRFLRSLPVGGAERAA